MNITDEQLWLYLYNDEQSAETCAAIERAIECDERLESRLAELQTEHQRLQNLPDHSVTAMQLTRWRQVLDRHIDNELLEKERRASKPERDRWIFFRPTALPAAVFGSLVLLIGITIGYWINQPEVPDSMENTHDRFALALQIHLQAVSADLSTVNRQSDLLLDLMAQNKRFIQAAKARGDDELARMLRAFNLLLADSSINEISDAAKARLLFELEVMQTKLNLEASNQESPTEMTI